MGIRRKAREYAMQALFFLDMGEECSQDKLELYYRHFSPEPDILPFFQRLANGVLDSREQIDAIIERFSSNWKIGRMSCVDRNVLRISVFEMLFCTDIPPKVSINEAIEIGKKYGTEESGAFINGILDGIRMAIEKGEIRGEKLET